MAMAATLLVAGCAAPQTFRYRQIVMGVETAVSIVADDEAAAREAGRVAFARLAELEQVMSDYRPDSELMRLCATHDVAVPASDDLIDVLGKAEAVRVASGGLFDVSVGPLTLLWRDARRAGAFPSDAAIAAARARSCGEAIEIDRGARTVTLRRADMRLDLGGIGKGFAAAKAIGTLRDRGFPRALVAIAGDIAAGDPPPGRRGWSVEIEAPDGSRTAIELVRSSVSTSGDREQYLERDGVRYSHLLDPHTGIGATTQRQVTVVGPDGAIVDALSSALAIAAADRVDAILARFAPDYRAIRYERPVRDGRLTSSAGSPAAARRSPE